MDRKIYLYVKQHRKTGLKYFGMTATKDPYVYQGSGKYWRRHLKMYGIDIDTPSVCEFQDLKSCEEFAIEFSEKNNIVESKEWAILRPENGKDGKAPGSPGMKKEKNPNWGKTGEQNSFYGKKHKPETIELLKKIQSNKPKGKDSPRAKKVNTLIGQFGCLKDAAEALGISTVTLRSRIKNNTTGFSYV